MKKSKKKPGGKKNLEQSGSDAYVLKRVKRKDLPKYQRLMLDTMEKMRQEPGRQMRETEMGIFPTVRAQAPEDGPITDAPGHTIWGGLDAPARERMENFHYTADAAQALRLADEESRRIEHGHADARRIEVEEERLRILENAIRNANTVQRPRAKVKTKKSMLKKRHKLSAAELNGRNNEATEVSW